MLRAENSEAIELALTKRSTRVGTLILHSVNPVSHPKEADIDATDLHAEASVCGDVIHSSHLDKAHLLYSSLLRPRTRCVRQNSPGRHTRIPTVASA